jgi:hypothetical protein
MSGLHHALMLVVAAAGSAPEGRPQAMIPSVPSPAVLLRTQFRTPLSYEDALKRLDEYYDQEIGRKGAAAFPAIGAQRHFELWHDMWVAFDPAGGEMTVTIQRPADGSTSRLVKSWMLNLAGRLDAPAPLEFQELPALHSTEGELYGSTRDLARVLKSDAAMKPLPTWEHTGLIVSADPLTLVVLAPAGLHGRHHVTVTAQTAAAAKTLWSRLEQGLLRPGIYSASSEETEVEEEIRAAAQSKADTLGAAAAQAIYAPRMDPKLIEAEIRTEPEMSRRLLAAQHQYDVRFRIDKPYRKVVVSWTELKGYSRADGRSQGEQVLGQSTLAAPKAPAPGALLVAHTRIENLKPGAYRVNLQGENAAGELLKIDERTYWFDGKSFEEL